MYSEIVNAALLCVGIGIGWMTWNEIQRLMGWGWHRKPKRCTVRKVWDSNDNGEV